MEIKAVKADLPQIQPFRTLFLQEFNHQFICNSFHERGWAQSYLLTAADTIVGYGALCGSQKGLRDTVFEFYVVPSYRNKATLIFSELLSAAQAAFIECQTNDSLITFMLYEFAENINTNVVLFEDAIVTQHAIPSASFRSKKESDKIFDHKGEPQGDYVLELNGEIVATGGFLLHYNIPFADLYMEVKEEHRGKGLASFLLQEIKKKCYAAGRVPAARCNVGNKASRATLIKSGLRVCGFEVKGTVKSVGKGPNASTNYY